MIFVVLGTQKFQCNRLLREMDLLVESGVITEKVFAQKGNSDYVPKHYEFTDFLVKEEFEKYVKESSLMITHSGVGTILAAIKNQKPVIVYPRLKKFKEHVDNHQLEIATDFSKKGLVLMCGEHDDLGQMIAESKTFSFGTYVSERENVLKVIRDFIQNDSISNEKTETVRTVIGYPKPRRGNRYDQKE